MSDDPPARRTRRPRAELKELMLDGGAEVLAQQGIELQISSVSYAKVFEHLELTRGIRITYGSVHERIWDSLQEYQVEVIQRAGLWDSPTPDTDAWVRWLETMVAMRSHQPESSVSEASRSAAVASYGERSARRSVAIVPAPGDETSAEVFGRVSLAIADGLALREALTDISDLPIRVPTGENGEIVEWSTEALVLHGLRLALGLPAAPAP